MDNKLKEKILFEISEIDELLDASTPLFDLCKIKEPDFIEVSATAMVLSSFYHGIESIIVLIFKHYKEELPKGLNWHIELLNNAFLSNENRKEIFQNELKDILKDYMRFRHLARHIYAYRFEWSRMEHLFVNIKTNWESIKNNINIFIEQSNDR